MEQKRYGFSWIYKKTKGCRSWLIIYTMLVLCMPMIQLSFAFFMKLFIDIATGKSNMSLLRVGLYSIASIIIGGIVMMIHSILVKWIYGKMECRLRMELMNVIFSRRLIALSKQHTGELLTKLTVDIQAVSMCFPTLIDTIVGGAASALFAAAALFFLNGKIAILLLTLTPLLMFLMGALTPHIQKMSAIDKENEERNRSYLGENLSRILLIKTYAMQEKILERSKTIYQKKLKSSITLGMWEGLALFAGALSGNIMSLVTLGLGAYFVLSGETTVGSLIMIVQLLNYIVNPVAKFPVAIAGVGQAVSSAERIGQIYELPGEKKNHKSSSVNGKELVIKNLSFSYDDEASCDLLHNLNLTFAKGEVTGIVGQSGSGKSTLLKLLSGLYEPKNGTIELRTEQGTIGGEQLTEQVAYVPPDNYLFSGTILENIMMSEQKPQIEKINLAASDANILEFIKSLPDGFDTLIGESGNTLSSGQAQRIAIARAVYINRPVIIFDEPTANLDADSIEKFHAAVHKLALNNICIIVTHDISTISACDRIYLLDNGRAEEKLDAEQLAEEIGID
jgi:ABC-type bacteriocin/lantibiotic exporter with double-glycine peptidase domain